MPDNTDISNPSAPLFVLPIGSSAEEVTLGRQNANDADNSGAMWFEGS
ncbi:hypothetical protein [Streptomyces sp. NPDC093707]